MPVPTRTLNDSCQCRTETLNNYRTSAGQKSLNNYRTSAGQKLLNNYCASVSQNIE